MEKKEIIKYLDEIFKPKGFKKKGHTWNHESEALEKIINLQKSKYSNTFYINYGFIIKSIEIKNLEMHIYNRLSTLDDKENQKIMDLLDFENSITDEQRKVELKPIIEKYLLAELQNTNTEDELLNNLKNRLQLNDIPLVVKKHFHIE